MSLEGDRLSSLPDDLILKILALISTKQVIKTSVLSPRWRHIWTSMSCLNFSSREFRTLSKFRKFVKHVLYNRNSQTEVHSIKLDFPGMFRHVVVKRILKRVLKYAFSHNVQQLNVLCSRVRGEIFLNPFSSQSLKRLTLSGFTYRDSITTPITWDLLALTTLNLQFVTLYDDKSAGLFSNCVNLKNLTLWCCRIGSKSFNICHPGLSSLTLKCGNEGGNIVAPQLKNLTIRFWRGIHLISAPNLTSLRYEDVYNPLQLSADLLYLEVADICISHPSEDEADAREIVCLLQKLRTAKFLILNLEIIKLLSSSVKLISHRPSRFTNLKSLKIYPLDVTKPEITMSTEVKNYLLDSSQGATFKLVSYKEVRAVMNVACKLMRELQVLLDRWQEIVKQGKPAMEQLVERVNQLDTEMKWHFNRINEKLQKGYKTAGVAISMLPSIEGVLTKLRASQRDKLQVRFSNLCAETDTLMGNMVDLLKIRSDKKPRIYFRELDTASQQSS